MTTSHGSTNENLLQVGSAVMTRFETGYELHPIQRLAAAATASRWRDAIVAAVNTDGSIELLDLVTDAGARVWHYADLTASIGPGEPVSYNKHYGVLAVGRDYFSVAVA